METDVDPFDWLRIILPMPRYRPARPAYGHPVTTVDTGHGVLRYDGAVYTYDCGVIAVHTPDDPTPLDTFKPGKWRSVKTQERNR